jgi:hypothetical protein
MSDATIRKSDGILLVAGHTLMRGALMGKKWPVLQVSVMLAERAMWAIWFYSSINRRISWQGAGSGVSLDQQDAWQKTGRSLRWQEMVLLPPFKLERVASEQCPAAGFLQLVLA